MNGCDYFILSIYATLCSLYIQCAEDPLVYLHLVQTALSTVRWFNLGDDSNPPMVWTNRSMPLSRRRQWDPGIPLCRGNNANQAIDCPASMLRDTDMSGTGIDRPPVPLHGSMDVDLIAGHTNVKVTMVRHLIWDPGIASCAIVGAMPVSFEVFRRRQWDHASIPSRFHYSHVQHELVADSNVIVPTIPTTPSMDKASVERSVSMFHPFLPWIGSFLLPLSTRNGRVFRFPAQETMMARSLTPSVSTFHHCHPVLSRPTVPNTDSSQQGIIQHLPSSVFQLSCPIRQQSTLVPVQHDSVCSTHHLCPCCVPSDRVELLPIHVHMHYQSTFILDTAVGSTSIYGLEA